MKIPSNSSRQPSVRKKDLAAFTLIELLIVVAILAILAALLIPVARSGISKSQQATCLANMRQAAILVIQYAADNDGNFPATGGNLSWDDYMMQAGLITNFDMTRQGCPANKSKLSACFGFNYMQLGNLDSLSVSQRKGLQVEKPSETVMLSDGHFWQLPDPKSNPAWPNLVYWDDSFWFGKAAPPGHGEYVNVVWVDGHGSAMQRAELYTPNNMVPDPGGDLPPIPWYFAREKLGYAKP